MRSGPRVVHTDASGVALHRAQGPSARRVECMDQVLAASRVRTAWSTCWAFEPSARRVMRMEWSPHRANRVVAASYGQSGRCVVWTEWSPRHADSVVAVLGLRTEWLAYRADGVVAASCRPCGRRVERTDCVVEVL